MAVHRVTRILPYAPEQLAALVADVPPSAKGFTVDTPDAKVVDYGTRFGVSTGEDGKYHVQVLEGLAPGETVVVDPPDALEQGARVSSP